MDAFPTGVTGYGLIPPPPPALIGKTINARAGAYLVDVVLFNGFTYLIGLLAGQLHGLVLIPAAAFLGVGYTVRSLASWESILFGFGLAVVYFCVFEWLFGATPGKWIFRMRVIREDGQPCGLGAAVVRGVMRLVDSLFFCLPAILSMKPPRQQRLGDKLARTVVVGAGDGYIRQPRPAWRLLLAGGLYAVLLIPQGFAMAAVYIDRVGSFISNNAADINLVSADLGAGFLQKDEIEGDQFTGAGVIDGNQRWFASRSLTVTSKVVAVKHFPGDTPDSLKKFLDQDARAMFKDSTLTAKQTQQFLGADLGWSMEFSEQGTGKNVVGLVFIQQNVFVEVFLYGSPQTADLEAAKNLAQVILERIHSGYRAPDRSGAGT